jgi:sugar phosphate isomerase/epimerase
MMRLGFVSAILPDLGLEEVLRFASAQGFETVEVMCWPVGKAERRYAGVTHIDVGSMGDAEVDRIKELTAETGVSISSLGYYPNPLCPDREEAEAYIGHIKRVFDASEALGIGTATTFIGRDWTKSVDDNWARFGEVWKPLVRYAEDHGVRVAIENCPMLFTADEWPGGKNLATTPAIWRRMFNDIGSSSFGLNYDPSHLVWQQIDYIEPLWEFKDRLFHLHAKDVRIDRHRMNRVGILAEPLEFHTPKLPGLGEIDWGRFVSVLSDVGYDGPLAVEVEDRAYEATLETRKAALIQSGRFLRNFLP